MLTLKENTNCTKHHQRKLARLLNYCTKQFECQNCICVYDFKKKRNKAFKFVYICTSINFNVF